MTRTRARAVWEWLRDRLLGPVCPTCNYPSRGPRTIAAHYAAHPTHRRE